MRPLSRIAQASTPGRRAAAATALGCLTVLVTACGTGSLTAGGGHGTTTGHTSSGHAATHSHPSPASHTATPAPSHRARHRHTGTPSTPSGSDPSGGSGTAAAAACPSADLGVTAAATQGTAGSVYATVTFTNRGSRTCSLYGYPGVSIGTGGPYHQVGFAAVENPSPPRELVTLSPGAVASAVLQVAEAGNYSASQCRPERTSEMKVYPPNQTQALYTPFSATGCAGSVRLLTVSVVQPGHAPQA